MGRGGGAGPAWLHLDLTLGDWAADYLPAVFFFVAGLELKRELLVGELLIAVAVLGAIGYTVSLLITRLAVGTPPAQERVAAAILVSSVLASVIAVYLLRRRSRC